ncbi:lipocalin family protein [Flavobacterium aquatile]|uniref:Lipocalin-like domain-containing protein n=1 Tax=Flavobacterium aquatile LMG 4008 = ATCC 11947 TaxID=1453498 RepID=A0A095SRR2_9FLAO|nr:lipocalin family protein [Flavobacterium aquatile]KGD67044.1 hypothetical protein LG45_12505 [Flavobacterium aquatile LMG 4008 = ATCC 11947]OXA66346.1 hypothetical protein B0A61_11570 [Flavobacterium aquatile LMG 4008 = ATCC 11947]GEC79847.1 hypothetical protein FAQ01_27170 [Flavobacterium aquatile]
MKNRILLFLSVLVLGLNLTSCGDDDGPSTSGEIVGKWELYKMGSLIDGDEELYLHQHVTGCTKDYIEFKSDGTLERKRYGVVCQEVESNSGIYVKTGNNIQTTFGGSTPTSGKIKELSDSTLKVYFNYELEGIKYTSITVLKKA